MKSIKLYFAGEWGPRPEQGDLDIKNRLVSYLYPAQLTKWVALTKGKPGNVILDSGAFSAWNKGKSISLDEYITYAHHAIRRAEKSGKMVRVVNLDVIPGKVGQTKALNQLIIKKEQRQQNKELIESAAKQGYENLLVLKQNGITPIHVFHQGEEIKWLDKMLEQTDYIGISPANDMPTTSKKQWIYFVFEYLYRKGAKVDTHGFAVLIPELLRELPWTSADAISWLMIAANGSIIYPIGGFKNFDSSIVCSKPFNQFLVSSKQIAKGEKHLTDNILNLIKEDGYTYEQLQDYKVREEINVKTFHLFEEWLNAYKQKTEHEPIKGLF